MCGVPSRPGRNGAFTQFGDLLGERWVGCVKNITFREYTNAWDGDLLEDGKVVWLEEWSFDVVLEFSRWPA
jgi:hypothetical protein